MYQLGKRSRHTHRVSVFIGLLLLLLAVGAMLWAARHFLRAETSLQQSPPVKHEVTLPQGVTKVFEEPTFRIDLPTTWKVVSSPQGTAHKPFSWRGSDESDRTRSLDVYVDDIPATMAVNRMLPLRADSTKLTIMNSVSDNCAGFTRAIATTPTTGAAPAKWSGVNFLCDMANKTRDVTGTSSPGGINTVTLPGAAGAHRYFFVYTDNSGQPDYDIFTTALKTFRTK